MFLKSAYYLINCFIISSQVQATSFNSLEKESEEALLEYSEVETTFLNKEIDIPNLDIESIPIRVMEKMTAGERLTLSNYNNKNLKKLDEEWLKQFSNNLKELTLKNYNLNEGNLEAIASLNSLEKLTISRCKGLNFNSSHLAEILKKLRYLDISNCGFNDETLEFIYSNASSKLEFLDFSLNNLSNFPFKKQNAFPMFKESLKVLKLNDCYIRDCCSLEKFFIFNNLEEIELSGNDFSEICEGTIKKFINSEMPNIQNSTQERFSSPVLPIKSTFSGLNQFFIDERARSYYEVHTSKLRNINLKNCKITSELFISRLFNLENLESLKISFNQVKINIAQALKGKACNKLKVLEMASCKSLNSNNLKNFTSFPNLEILDISWNNFENLPENFELGCSRKSLREIYVHFSKLNPNGLKAITDCPKLEKLLAGPNKFKDIPENFELGCSRESLKNLSIYGSELNRNGLKAITNCSKLEILDVNCNDFENLPENFELGCSKETLIELQIHRSKLNFNGLKAITDCPKLEILTASENNFEGIPKNFELGRSKESLKDLTIRFSQLNNNGFKAVTDCAKLEILTASENMLEDNDFELGKSKGSLKSLYLRKNSLGLFALKKIAECSQLQILNFGNNKLDLENLETKEMILKLSQFLETSWD